MRAPRGTRLASATIVMTLTLVPSLVHGQARDTPSISSDEEEKAKRFQLFVHASYQPTLRNFDEATSFTQFLEQGSTSRTYTGGSGTAFEFGGVFSLTPELALMGSFEIVSATHDATLVISVPHPLLFNRPRTASTDIDALDYSARALHFDIAYRIAVPRVEIDLFVGPSIFFAKTELLDQGTTDSQYPFDELSLTAVSRVTLDKSALGFNAGAGVTYYVTEAVGVSFLTRFSQADIEALREGGEPVAFDAGGFRVGGGIRIKF